MAQGRSRRAPCVAAAAALLVLVSPPLAQARQPGRPNGLRVQWNAGLGAIYDTNLERQSDGPGSLGVVASAGTRLVTTRGRSALTLDYDYAQHRYELSDQYSRSSHTARSSLTTRVNRALLLAVAAEYALGSSSEDREIGTQYSLIPRFELRPDPRHRLRLQAGYRRRRFGDLSGSNSDNVLAALDYRLGASRRPTVELGSRFDVNTTMDPRSRFERWTQTVRFTAPLGSTAELSLEVRQSTRSYPHRLLHMESSQDLDAVALERLAQYYEAERGRAIPGAVLTEPDSSWMRVPRRDEIWMPALGFTWRPSGGLEIEFGHQFETRISNDLRKGFSGHTATLGTRFRR